MSGYFDLDGCTITGLGSAVGEVRGADLHRLAPYVPSDSKHDC